MKAKAGWLILAVLVLVGAWVSWHVRDKEPRPTPSAFPSPESLAECRLELDESVKSEQSLAKALDECRAKAP